MKYAFSRKNAWEKTPALLKVVLGGVLDPVPSAYLLGRRFRNTLRFVDQAQWWPTERARAWQLDRVREICELAYVRSAYYRRSFDAAGFQPAGLTSL